MSDLIKKKVLIVEDELLIAYSIKEMLDPLYEIVDTVICFEDAMEVLANTKVDIVLIDITLAGSKTGMDLAEEVIKFNIPFIFLTALTHEKGLDKLLSYNPAAYLSKPISKPDLITAVRLALSKHKVQHKNLFEFHVGKILYTFNMDKLIYIEADHIYCHIILTDEKAMIRVSLSKLVESSKKQLKRINRKTAINPDYIRSQTSSSITLSNDMTFPLSKTYAS